MLAGSERLRDPEPERVLGSHALVMTDLGEFEHAQPGAPPRLADSRNGWLNLGSSRRSGREHETARHVAAGHRRCG